MLSEPAQPTTFGPSAAEWAVDGAQQEGRRCGALERLADDARASASR